MMQPERQLEFVAHAGRSYLLACPEQQQLLLQKPSN
jgi:hypothetical protein